MDELDKIEDFLKNDPRLGVWKTKLRKGWVKEEEFFEALERIYRTKMKKLGLDPNGDIPMYNIPEDFGNPEADVLVGYPVHDERAMAGLYLPIWEMTGCHVGLWGKTRWGKSYQKAHLVTEVVKKEPERGFLIYDTQSEFNRLLSSFLPDDKLLAIRFEDYWKNPLQDIFDYGIDEALGNFKRALMESQFIGAQSVNLLENINRRRCASEKLSALGPPSLKEMLFNVKKIEKDKGRKWGKAIEYLHSLINIIGNLSLNLPALNHEISKGFSFHDIEGKVAVIYISSIRDPISLKFFITKELLDLLLYAESSHRPMTVILDETHRFAPLSKQFGTYSNAALVDAVKTSLKLGINFWMAEQNPGQFVHPAILANVGTHFVFRLPSIKDRWPVMHAINIESREQADNIGKLETQHCLLYSDSLKEAVLIKTPDIVVQDCDAKAIERSDSMIRLFHERFFNSGPDRLKTCWDESETNPPVQSLIKTKIAKARANNPLSGITETYADVGVSAETGKKHVGEMLELGWLEGPERMPTSGKGNRTIDCYVVTEKGCDALGLDQKKAGLPGKGSFKSRLAARMIGEFLKKEGKVVRYEHLLSSSTTTKAADVAVLESNGQVVAYEYQNAEGHLAENILRNSEAGFGHTVVVCPNQNVLKKMRKKTAKEGIQDNAIFKTLKEFSV